MDGQYHTKNGRTSKRGAFINGSWYCDCEPRMPAEKFQTKNGGKNHGRWFFTCQKPQPKRCSFFLWSDDAKIREEAAVLNNSRTEPQNPQPPQTPKKPVHNKQPLTPFSVAKLNYNPNQQRSPESEESQGTLNYEQEESFGWSPSGDDDLTNMAEAVAIQQSSSPRKSARTTQFDSPGKRKHEEKMSSSITTDSTWPFSDDVFMTPTTSTKSGGGLASPISAQVSKYTHQNLPSVALSSLSAEVLSILKPANISSTVEHELVTLLDRYDLRTQGIIKGRDITRVAVQAKEKKIAELQARIASLEADQETTRAVIAHLKQDIAMSPKRPKHPQIQTSRYEV